MKRAKGVKGKLDRLVGNWIRSLGWCEHCYSKQNLQWCHIRTRQYNCTRWSEYNSVCMCAHCHSWFGNNPDRFIKWLSKWAPKKLRMLEEAFQHAFPMKEWQMKEQYDLLKKKFKKPYDPKDYRDEHSNSTKR